MQADGGFCASGGPYVVARQCSGGDMRLLMAGILGGLLCTAILVAATAGLGLTGSRAALLAWTGMFGLLGWNFISLGLHPAGSGGTSGSSGWLVSGGVFWLLAAGGLVPLLSGIIGDLRTAGRPDPLLASTQPLVRAAFVPGVSVPQPGPPPGWPGSAAAAGFGGLTATGPVTGLAVGAGPAPADPRARQPGLLSGGTWLAGAVIGAGTGFAVAGPALVTLLR
jgi:hypothetical protein